MNSYGDMIEPKVFPDKMKDSEVKIRTNFGSEAEMLLFVFVVCNGDVDVMTGVQSSMTWFEECFFVSEFLWGRTLLRWCDAECENGYGLNHVILRRVYKGKLNLMINARNSWPRYAKHDEDVKLCRDYWNERYEGHRVVQWDNTNVSIGNPSGARKQRTTFSSYYGENCAKGGVFLQLCGWMGVHKL